MKKWAKKTKNALYWLLIAAYRGLRREKMITAGSNRFLVVSTTGVGDTLWGVPAIRALKKSFPEGWVGVLTSPLGEEILRHNPDIDEFFIFDKKGAGGPLSLFALWRRLRRSRFDTAFFFHASSRIIWPLTVFTGAGEIIGVAGVNKGLDFALTKVINPPEGYHAIKTRLQLVAQAGVEPAGMKLSLYLTAEERRKADCFLDENGLKDASMLIGLHPGAQKAFKCWPAERFGEAGAELSRLFGARVLVTGDRSEAALAEEVCAAVPGAVSAAGLLSLREMAAILERLSVFITNDTGPMHMAFAVGTPTVALFAPTNPEGCGPLDVPSARVIKKGRVHSPCRGKNCDRCECMAQIPVAEVLSETVALLSQPEKEGA